MTATHEAPNKKPPNKRPQTKKGRQKLEQRIRRNLGQKRPEPHEDDKALKEQRWYREIWQPTLFDIASLLQQGQQNEPANLPRLHGAGLYVFLMLILNFFGEAYAGTWVKPYRLPKARPVPGPGPRDRDSRPSSYNPDSSTDLFKYFTTFRGGEGGPATGSGGDDAFHSGDAPSTSGPISQILNRNKRDNQFGRYHVTASHAGKHHRTGTHHQSHAHSHLQNATVYPADRLSQYMRDLVNAVGSFENLIAPGLKKLGLEPDTPLVVTVVHAGELNSQTNSGSQTKILSAAEVVQHFSTTEKYAVTMTPDSEKAAKLIGRIKHIWKHHRQNFLEHEGIKPLKHKFKSEGVDVIGKKLEAYGIDLDDPATVYYVDGTAGKGLVGSMQPHTGLRATLGAIIEVEKNGHIQRFAIIPHTHNMVVSNVPRDAALWKRWMNSIGKHLFFQDPNSIPARTEFFVTPAMATETNSLDTVKRGIIHTLKPIIDQTLTNMAGLVSNASPVADAFHAILGTVIPYYDFVKAVVERDYRNAAIFLGFELVPFLGSGAKWFVKAKFIGKHLGGTPQRIAETVVGFGDNNIAETSYGLVQSANGLGVFKNLAQTGKQGAKAAVRNDMEGDHSEQLA